MEKMEEDMQDISISKASRHNEASLSDFVESLSRSELGSLFEIVWRKRHLLALENASEIEIPLHILDLAKTSKVQAIISLCEYYRTQKGRTLGVLEAKLCIELAKGERLRLR